MLWGGSTDVGYSCEEVTISIPETEVAIEDPTIGAPSAVLPYDKPIKLDELMRVVFDGQTYLGVERNGNAYGAPSNGLFSYDFSEYPFRIVSTINSDGSAARNLIYAENTGTHLVEIYGDGVQIVVSECFGSAVEKIINEVPQFPYLVTVTGTNPIKMDKTWQEIREAFARKRVVVSDDSLISMASFLADVITVEGSGDVSGYSVTVAKNGKLLQFLASSTSDKPEYSKLD